MPAARIPPAGGVYPLENIRLDGQVAIVTAASQGIGRAIVRLLARYGASVAFNYLQHAEDADALVKEVQSLGSRALALRADSTEYEDVSRLVEQTLSAFGGRIDVLVNNAGGLVKRAPFHEMDEETLDTIIALNVKSAYYACRAVVPVMVKQRYGRIVNFSSVAARTGGGPGAVPYAMTKGAIATMTRGLARELAPHGITVNAIAPGVIMTPFHEKYSTPEVLEQFKKQIPLGRLGSAEEVAWAALYLVSPMGSYVTGEVMEVNGGQLMA